MTLRVVSLAILAVFASGLQQSQPWAHSVWTHAAWERFLIAMCATAIACLAFHRYWFYGIVFALACSVGVQPIAGLAFVLLGGLNLGWLLFHQKDDRLNLLAGFAIYVWLFSLTASLPINTVWFWGVALAVPIAIGRTGDDSFVFTLTSRTAQIPLSFSNLTHQTVRVKVHLASTKLTFPKGATSILELPPHNITKRFEVQARTSGTFTLRVTLTTADDQFTINTSVGLLKRVKG